MTTKDQVEPAERAMRALWPWNVEANPLDVYGVVSCWATELNGTYHYPDGRAVLVYDREEAPGSCALPREFHLRELMHLDLSQPEEIANFCSQYGQLVATPRRGLQDDGSVHTLYDRWNVITPEVARHFKRLESEPRIYRRPDGTRCQDLTWIESEIGTLAEEARSLLRRDEVFTVLLPEDDENWVSLLKPRGIRWAIAVDLEDVRDRLALLRDMVRCSQFSRGALSCADVRSAAELRISVFSRDEEYLLELDAPSLLRQIRLDRKRMSDVGLLQCGMRFLEDPHLRAIAFDAMASLLNTAIASFGQFIERHVPVGTPERPHPQVSLYQAVCMAVYADLTSPKLAYTRCGNETCNTLFIHRRVGSGDNRGWTTGQKYCTPECARMQAQRQYRRRVQLARQLAREGVGIEDIAQQVDRDVFTVRKWLR